MKKYIVLLFASLFVSVNYNSQEKEDPLSSTLPDIMPQYTDGEEAMSKFIKENIFYPVSALKDSIEGRVVVQFVVDTTGHLKDITIVKGIHPDCDIITKNIIQLMPKWQPGRLNGKLSPMLFTITIMFEIPEDEDRIISMDCAMPTFVGGEKAMYEYVRENMKYPVTLSSPQCEGRVFVRFVINNEGKVKHASIIRGLSPQTDTEALRIVNMMLDWTPAKCDGKVSNYLYILPIVFRFHT